MKKIVKIYGKKVTFWVIKVIIYSKIYHTCRNNSLFRSIKITDNNYSVPENYTGKIIHQKP